MGFLSNLFAATPENPRFSLNDPAAWDALGVQPTSSGVQVNAETALTHSPWWRGINLLANDTAKLSLLTYLKTGEGESQKQKLAKKHPAYPLLLRKANEYMTAGVWKKTMMGHAVGLGNGYSYIMRNGAGDPGELLPLNPYDTYPIRENGKLWYVTKVSLKGVPGGDEERKLPAEEVFHLKGLSHDGLLGYGVVDKAREVLGLGMGERKHQSIYFRNGARPSIILTAPGRLNDQQKKTLVNDWERMQSGLENAHRTALLDNGLQAREISFNAVDSQLLESRRFDLIDVANFLGIPPHKVGASTNTSYGSLEQENQAYLDAGLDPWLCAIEEEAWDKLLTEEEKDKDSIEVRFNRRGLVQANYVDRSNAHSKELAGQPWRSVEEVRVEEGWNPEPEVGEIKAPLNMGPPGAPGEQGQPGGPTDGSAPPKKPAPPPAPEKDSVSAPPKKPKKAAAKLERKAAIYAAHSNLLADAARRMVKRIGVHAERAAAKDGKTFEAWGGAFEMEHRETCREALEPAIAACVACGLLKPTVTIGAADWLLAQLGGNYAQLLDRATPKTLAEEAAKLTAEQTERLPREIGEAFLFKPE